MSLRKSILKLSHQDNSWRGGVGGGERKKNVSKTPNRGLVILSTKKHTICIIISELFIPGPFNMHISKNLAHFSRGFSKCPHCLLKTQS